ncbi:Protein ssh4 [Cladobotryum mycophilum]|uniref:Protein ssh4 n=1 Tax=Cladobotryum mycophilum TaxID=491253 RepID=A0ABR0SKL0_9HYPO
MCFGSKKETNDDPPPRPAHHSSGQSDVKTSNYSLQSGAPSGYQSYPPAANMGQSQYQPPTGPPPGQQQQNNYAPPSGPPPGQHQDYAPPPGPPPIHQQGDYAPPAGPPPPRQYGDYAPPPGPPPSSYDWAAAVPDTSLFPPPPAIFSGYDRSHANNATEQEAEAGEAWCEQYPLVRPMELDQAGKGALQFNNFRLMEPAGFDGRLNWLGPGHWEGHTSKHSQDRCIIGYPPLYSVTEHDPTVRGQPKTIYYEVKIRPNSRTTNIAIGFTALPYPSFRLPGWHRGSLGVHGDDGHRYINDRWGGKDFTTEFHKGETIGIGMTFTPTGTHKPRVDIFLTRNGVRTGGWDLHEETDAEQDLPVTGLEGFHDLSCAIGAFEGTDFEVVFDPAKWVHQPVRG